jgi:hypothetical protein
MPSFLAKVKGVWRSVKVPCSNSPEGEFAGDSSGFAFWAFFVVRQTFEHFLLKSKIYIVL